MGARTGKQYLDNLQKHPREVWLRGERIDDVSTHLAFEAARSQIARLYDLQHDPALRDILTYTSPTSGDRVASSFMIPQTLDDIVRRRNAFRAVAEATFG